MGRQLGAAVADKILHPTDVVLQRLAMQDQGRQADVTDQVCTEGGGAFSTALMADMENSYSLMRRARLLALSINTRR